MKLREYLQIPFVLEVYSYERADGSWINRVSYPELGDCAVEGKSLEVIIEDLDRLRVRIIRERLVRGTGISLPRELDEHIDPRLMLEQLNLLAEVGPYLDLDEQELRRRAQDQSKTQKG